MDSLPRDVQPQDYRRFLREIGADTKKEKALLVKVVREELSCSELTEMRFKLSRFLFWLASYDEMHAILENDIGLEHPNANGCNPHCIQECFVALMQHQLQMSFPNG